MHEASSVMTGFSDLHIQQILSIIQGKVTIQPNNAMTTPKANAADTSTGLLPTTSMLHQLIIADY
jgi:ABC-type lipoprotein release transport system permease subunit